jgi:hypothetical protein
MDTMESRFPAINSFSTKEAGMKLEKDVKAIRARWLSMFPLPQAFIGEAESAFEERMRRWSIGFAEQVAWEIPGQGYGVKRADPGRPIGKDTLARNLPVTGLICWDLATGAGTGHPSLNEDPDSQDITGQFFVTSPEDFLPRNHLGRGEVVPLPPTPVPVPVGGGPTMADVNALRAAIMQQERLVKELEDANERRWQNHEQQLAELRGQVQALTKIEPPKPRGTWPWS